MPADIPLPGLRCSDASDGPEDHSSPAFSVGKVLSTAVKIRRSRITLS